MYKKWMNRRFAVVTVAVMGLMLAVAGCDNKKAEGGEGIKIEGKVISARSGEPYQTEVSKFQQDKTAETQQLSKQFAGLMAGKFSVDAARGDRLPSATVVPALLLDGKKLNNDHSVPDMLEKKVPGSAATIFVRSGDDFVRIATSLKRNESPTATGDVDRASGTMLNRTHPAYNNLIAGTPYHGTATLYNSPYMTEYAPIKDASGTVIGALFVGMDIGPDITIFRRKLDAM